MSKPLEPTVPEHVAAYAAGLYTGDGPGASWAEVAMMVSRMGLGSYTSHHLADAGARWAERNGTTIHALHLKAMTAGWELLPGQQGRR